MIRLTWLISLRTTRMIIKKIYDDEIEKIKNEIEKKIRGRKKNKKKVELKEKKKTKKKSLISLN